MDCATHQEFVQLLGVVALLRSAECSGVKSIYINSNTGGSMMRLQYSAVSTTVLISSALVGFSGSNNVLAADSGTSATSETQLEEVVVTAERRVADIQKSANSVTVRTGTDLQNQGRFSLQQILEDVPGVQASAGGGPGGGVTAASQANTLTIRGIPSNSGGGGGAPNPVASAAAIYVDGVYNGVGGGYDISRVEVLRGPQGTLYGRSATSGLVATFTANPTLDKVSGNASVEAGNYSLLHASAAVNVPLGSVFAVRVAGNRYQRDGYYDKNGGAQETTDGKIKLLYQPSDDFSFLLGAAMQNNSPKTGGVTLSLSNSDRNTVVFTRNQPVNGGSNKHRQYWGELNWNLGFATLTWQPAFRTFSANTATDNLGFTNGTGVLDLRVKTNVTKDDTHTEELRLASNGDSNLTWLAGLFYYDQGYAASSRNDARGGPPLFPGPFYDFVAFDAVIRDKSTQDIGAYAQATLAFADSWRLTGGVRYDDTKISIDGSYCATNTLPGPGFGVLGCGSIPNPKDNGHRSYKDTTWKARIETDLTPQNLLYASVSTGFSPGDVSLTQDASNLPYILDLKAETLTAWEVGSKNRFLGNSLQVNGSAYFLNYGAYQTAGINCTPNGPTPTSCGLSAPAKVQGAEFETIYQLTPSDRLGFNMAFTNARFTGKTQPVQVGSTSTTFGYFFAKDKIPNVVPFSASASYDHNFALPGGSKLTAHGDARYLAGRDLNNITQDQYAGLLASQGLRAGGNASQYLRGTDEVVANLSVTWASSSDMYSVTGYMRNVFDNQYKTTATVPLSGTGLYGTALYDPRTFGVVLNARF
jgi:iron complex outermembrane receptor protein